MRLTILSYGGGVQTVAMCVLVAQGRIARPDAIIYAETRDSARTLAYRDFLSSWMLERGFPAITTVAAPVSLTATLERGKPVIPMYGSDGGQLPRVCTERWKIRTIRREIRRLGARTATVMLGFSLDELGRMKSSNVRWAQNAFPLIDLRLTRRDCETVIADAGLAQPPKSACDVCPHRTAAGWAQLKHDDPEAFAYAVQTEARFPGLYLHATRKPLPIVAQEAEKQGGFDFDGALCGAGCWT